MAAGPAARRAGPARYRGLSAAAVAPLAARPPAGTPGPSRRRCRSGKRKGRTGAAPPRGRREGQMAAAAALGGAALFVRGEPALPAGRAAPRAEGTWGGTGRGRSCRPASAEFPAAPARAGGAARPPPRCSCRWEHSPGSGCHLTKRSQAAFPGLPEPPPALRRPRGTQQHTAGQERHCPSATARPPARAARAEGLWAAPLSPMRSCRVSGQPGMVLVCSCCHLLLEVLSKARLLYRNLTCVCAIPVFYEDVLIYNLTFGYIFVIVKRLCHLRVVTMTCSVFICSGEDGKMQVQHLDSACEHTAVHRQALPKWRWWQFSD